MTPHFAGVPHDPSRSTMIERLLDRLPVSLVTQPFEFALGFILVVNSTRQVFGDSSPSVADLPMIVQDIFMVLSLVGGLGLLVGLFLGQRVHYVTNTSPIPAGVAIERAFLHIVGSAYLALAIAILAANFERGLGQAIICLFVGLACRLRIHSIRSTTRVVIRTITKDLDGDMT